MEHVANPSQILPLTQSEQDALAREALIRQNCELRAELAQREYQLSVIRESEIKRAALARESDSQGARVAPSQADSSAAATQLDQRRVA